MNFFVWAWHNHLDMPKHDLSWHKQDIKDEIEELEEARGFVDRWSEYSDICYTYTRALWSGHGELKLPINYFFYLTGLIYMFPKYTLRWNYYHKLGYKFGNDKVHEVRNPKKVSKLEVIAEKYGFDKEKFVTEALKLLKKSFFLK